MAESTPNADATSDAGATPAGVAEAVPAPTDDAAIGDAGKRALAELRRELKEITSCYGKLSACSYWKRRSCRPRFVTRLRGVIEKRSSTPRIP